jgi:GNAT superfamily N-acetyltransferase
MFPTASLTVRPATSDDLSTVFGLIQALAAYEKLSHAVVGTSTALAKHLFGAQPSVETILAESEGQVVGFALFFTSYSTFLTQPGIYLEDLFVLPDYRGLGVGKALLTRLAQIVLERQWGRLDWSVLDWNTSAINFYRRIGATVLEDVRVCRVTGDALQHLADRETPLLRSATEADVPVLFELARANAKHHDYQDQFVGSAEALSEHLFGESVYAQAIVAEQSNQIVGFALFFTNYSTFLTKPGLFIEDLFVQSDYRYQGWGTALVSALARQTIDRDYGRLEWLVQTANQPAIDFYQRLGATILADWRVCQLAGAALAALAQPSTTRVKS